MEKVSIVIPVYNREKFISEAIESCLMQTYKNLEIIIFDNSSTDSTWNICQEYSKKYSIIHLYQNKTNLGPVLNWENCISKCNGMYVKVLFSDDLLYNQCIELMVKKFTDEISFVFSSINIGKRSNETQIQYHWKRKSGVYSVGEYISSLFWSGRVPVSPGASLFRLTDLYEWIQYRKSHSDLQQYMNNGAGLDALMFFIAAKNKKKVAYIEKPLVFFRIHNDSLTVKNEFNEVSENYKKFFLWFAKKEYSAELAKNIFLKYWLKACISDGELISAKKAASRYDFILDDSLSKIFLKNFFQMIFLNIYWRYK
jgi:glycosyltransferase involved in cell wall biosynthesis